LEVRFVDQLRMLSPVAVPASASAIVELSKGQRISIEARTTEGLAALGPGSSFHLELLNGPQGLRGEPGTAGGSLIDIGSDATTVQDKANRLSFASSSFTVSADGNGGVLIDTVKELDHVGVMQAASLPRSETTCTAPNWQRKLHMQTPTLSAGHYRIAWNYIWSYSNQDRKFHARVLQDDALALYTHREEPKDVESNHPVYFVRYIVLAEGAHTFDVEWCSDHEDDFATISDVQLELWRV